MEFDIKDTRAKDNSQKSRSSNIVLQGLARIMFYLLKIIKISQLTKKNCDIGNGNLPLRASHEKIFSRCWQMDLNSRASCKKLVAQQRRHARVYKCIAAASVPFCGEEGIAERYEKFPAIRLGILNGSIVHSDVAEFYGMNPLLRA